MRRLLLTFLVACTPPAAPAAEIAVAEHDGGAPRAAGVPKGGARDAVLLRLAERAGSAGGAVVLPEVAELPSGGFVVASNAVESDLGPGATRIAEGFVAAFDASGARTWLCLSATAPQLFGVDGRGLAYALVSHDAKTACASNAGTVRADGARVAPKAASLLSDMIVAVGPSGAEEWSKGAAATLGASVTQGVVAADGSLALMTYDSKAGNTLVALDGNHGVRWKQSLELESPSFAVAKNHAAFVSGRFPPPVPSHAIAKVTAEGKKTWAVNIDGSESMQVGDIAADGDDVLVVGSAAGTVSIGGTSVSCAPGGSAFVARIAEGGRARWIRAFETAHLERFEHLGIVGEGDATVIVVSSHARMTPNTEPDRETTLLHLDHDGNETKRRSLHFHGMGAPRFAASRRGVLLVADVTNGTNDEGIFRDVPPAKGGASAHAIVVMRLGL